MRHWQPIGWRLNPFALDHLKSFLLLLGGVMIITAKPWAPSPTKAAV